MIFSVVRSPTVCELCCLRMPVSRKLPSSSFPPNKAARRRGHFTLLEWSADDRYGAANHTGVHTALVLVQYLSVPGTVSAATAPALQLCRFPAPCLHRPGRVLRAAPAVSRSQLMRPLAAFLARNLFVLPSVEFCILRPPSSNLGPGPALAWSRGCWCAPALPFHRRSVLAVPCSSSARDNLIVLWNTNPATSIAERICRAP